MDDFLPHPHRLRGLRGLVLDTASLNTVPPRFEQLEQLGDMDIDCANFETFPEKIVDLPRLKKFSSEHEVISYLWTTPQESCN